jgi:hypothetical protein
MARRYPKWFLAVFAIALAAAALVTFWLGGNPGEGVVSFAVIAGAGLLTLVFGRSELVRGLRGDGRARVHRRARWACGSVASRAAASESREQPALFDERNRQHPVTGLVEEHDHGVAVVALNRALAPLRMRDT